MRLTKVETQLAQSLWMTLYVAGTPVEIQFVPAGTLVIIRDDSEYHEEEDERYYPVMVSTCLKKYVRAVAGLDMMSYSEVNTFPLTEKVVTMMSVHSTYG